MKSNEFIVESPDDDEWSINAAWRTDPTVTPPAADPGFHWVRMKNGGWGQEEDAPELPQGLEVLRSNPAYRKAIGLPPLDYDLDRPYNAKDTVTVDEPSIDDVGTDSEKNNKRPRRPSQSADKPYSGSAAARAIQKANPSITDVNKIRVGSTIKIPGQSDYTIQRGDTLDKIAARFIKEESVTSRILELAGLSKMKSSEFLNEADSASPTYHNMGLKQQPMPAPGSTVAWDAPLYVNPSVSMGAPLPSGDPIENVKAGIQDAKEFYDLARKAGMPIGDAIPLAYKAGVMTATGDIGGMVQAVTAHSNKNLDKGIQQLKSTIKDYTDLYAQMLPTSEYYKKNIAPNPQLKAQADEFIKTNMTPQQFAQSIQQAEATLKAPSTMPTQASPTVPSAQAALGQPASQPAAPPTNETTELNRILQLSGMEFIAEDSTKSITVKRGDTLSRIAQDNSTTVDAILKINDIPNPNLIRPGDVIRIPGGQGDPDGIKKRQGAGQSDQSEKRTKTTTSTGNAKIAMEFFLEQGWTPEQAAGLVANLQAESYDRLDPAALGDKGRGYGIAQWHGPRQKKFEEIIGVPLKGSSLENQLKFVQWELTNPESAERSAGTRLKSAKTAADAAAVIDEFYERSSGIHRQRRIAKAEALLTAVA